MSQGTQIPASPGDISMSPGEDDATLDLGAVPSKRFEIIIAVGCTAFSILALVLSQSIRIRGFGGGGGLDPKWWPTVLSSLSLGLSVLLLAASVFGPAASRDDLERPTGAGWFRLLATFAAAAAYVVVWSSFNYIVATLAYLVVQLLIVGVRKPIPLVLFPVITTAFIYGLFHTLLRVPL